MPYICLRRSDIPAGVLQVTDFWPNASQRNQSIDPQPQGPRYPNQPVTATPVLSSTGLAQRYFATAQSGLAAYLTANVEGPSGAALTPAQADAAAAAVIAAMRAGGAMTSSAINALLLTTAAVAATGTLTFTGNALNTETVTIGGKVYTFQTVLTNVNGNVLIGGSASASLDNLIAAINLGAGAGTLYAAATTLHPTVSAAAGAGDTMVGTAKTAGSAGNAITTTTTVTGASWTGATLAGGDEATISGGTSTGTVADVLRILAGATYTVPAGTVVQTPLSVFNPQSSPTTWNAANFDYATFKEILVSDSSFYISLAEGQLRGYTSSAFNYKGTTGAALVVYDNTGAVL